MTTENTFVALTTQQREINKLLARRRVVLSQFEDAQKDVRNWEHDADDPDSTFAERDAARGRLASERYWLAATQVRLRHLDQLLEAAGYCD